MLFNVAMNVETQIIDVPARSKEKSNNCECNSKVHSGPSVATLSQRAIRFINHKSMLIYYLIIDYKEITKVRQKYVSEY